MRLRFVFILGFTMVACQHAHSSRPMDEDVAPLDAAKLDPKMPWPCAVGEYVALTLAAIPTIGPQATDFSGEGPVDLQLPEGDPIRIDTCLAGDDTFVIGRVIHGAASSGLGPRQQILVMNESTSVPTRADPVGIGTKVTFLPVASLAETGLKAAVLDQDVSTLRISLTWIDPDLGPRRWLLASIDANGPAAAATFQRQSPTNEWRVIASPIPAGRLEVGDPFKLQAGCDAGEVPAPLNFKAGTATFKGTLCGHSTGVSSFVYHVVKLVISDESPSLTPSGRGEKVYDTKEALEGVLRSTVGHHNSCDSLVITLPEVTYKATSVPVGPSSCLDEGRTGALEIPEGAPSGKAAYFVQYGTQPPDAGFLNCNSWRNCP